MPVVGTPVNPATQNLLEGVQTAPLFEKELPTRRRSLVLDQHQLSELRLQILDRDGAPRDLTPFTASQFTAFCAFREGLVGDNTTTCYQRATLEDPPTGGWLRVITPEGIRKRPGIYLLEAAISDDSGIPRGNAGEVVLAIERTTTNLKITVRREEQTNFSSSYDYDYLFAVNAVPIVAVNQILTDRQALVRDVNVVLKNTFTLVVEYGALGVDPDSTSLGPPTLVEIRLHLRDFPQANLLLDEYEFDPSEILHAAMSVVREFNETLPVLPRQYSSQDFPWRYHWMIGTLSHLCEIMAQWHRRNRLPYSAGGVQIDDIGKEREYTQASIYFRQRYQEWLKNTKRRLNMESCFGTVTSNYSSWYL